MEVGWMGSSISHREEKERKRKTEEIDKTPKNKSN